MLGEPCASFTFIILELAVAKQLFIISDLNEREDVDGLLSALNVLKISVCVGLNNLDETEASGPAFSRSGFELVPFTPELPEGMSLRNFETPLAAPALCLLIPLLPSFARLHPKA